MSLPISAKPSKDPVQASSTDSQTPDSCATVAFCTQCGCDILAHQFGSDLRGFAICPSCRHEMGAAPLPWEDQREKHIIEAFVHTAWSALSSPQKFFASLHPHPQALPALLFGMMCASTGSLAKSIWVFLLQDHTDNILRTIMPSTHIPITWLRAYVLLTALIRGPLVVVAMFLLIRFFLRLAGAHTHNRTIGRIVGYAMTSYLFMLIPSPQSIPIGATLTVIWMFHLLTNGIRRFHIISPTRAICAVAGAQTIFILFLMM